MKLKAFGSFFEKGIDGLFAGRLGKILSAGEIEKAVGKELAGRRKKTRRGFIVPNAYIISLGTDDYLRLSSARLLEELCVFIEKRLILSDSFMDERLSVRFEEDEARADGSFAVASRYEDEPREKQGGAEPDTIVLERTSFPVPLNLPPVRKIAALTVISGPDAGARAELGERKAYIGRREKNELSLTDAKASRLHAFIEYERHRHVIRDADSLNGMFVNGERKKDACLCSGDEISVGNTVIRYEVI